MFSVIFVFLFTDAPGQAGRSSPSFRAEGSGRKESIPSGRSRDARDAYLPEPKFLHFHAVFRKTWSNSRLAHPLRGWHSSTGNLNLPLIPARTGHEECPSLLPQIRLGRGPPPTHGQVEQGQGAWSVLSHNVNGRLSCFIPGVLFTVTSSGSSKEDNVQFPEIRDSLVTFETGRRRTQTFPSWCRWAEPVSPFHLFVHKRNLFLRDVVSQFTFSFTAITHSSYSKLKYLWKVLDY